MSSAASKTNPPAPVVCECQVQAINELAPAIYQIQLQLPSAHRHHAFYAGQYLQLMLDEERQIPYSIASTPGAEVLELHVMYQGADTLSAVVLDYLRANERVQVRLAMGECALVPEQLQADEALIFIAAGTCFAQMKAMVEEALKLQLPNSMHLYWGVREASQLYQRDVIEQWAAAHERLHFVPVVSDELEGWSGRTGFVHEALLADAPALEQAHVYVCGSPAMVYAVEDELLQAGLREGYLYSDVFAYAPRPAK